MRSVRLMKGVTTVWSEYLTFEFHWQGTVTFDPSYYPGRPLALTTSVTQGEVNLAENQVLPITVTVTDKDPEATLVYTWYIDGVAIAVGTGNSYSLVATNLPPGSDHFLSVIVRQGDNLRAADAEWTIAEPVWEGNFVIRSVGDLEGYVRVTGTLALIWPRMGIPQGT